MAMTPSYALQVNENNEKAESDSLFSFLRDTLNEINKLQSNKYLKVDEMLKEKCEMYQWCYRQNLQEPKFKQILENNEVYKKAIDKKTKDGNFDIPSIRFLKQNNKINEISSNDSALIKQSVSLNSRVSTIKLILALIQNTHLKKLELEICDEDFIDKHKPREILKKAIKHNLLKFTFLDSMDLSDLCLGNSEEDTTIEKKAREQLNGNTTKLNTPPDILQKIEHADNLADSCYKYQLYKDALINELNENLSKDVPPGNQNSSNFFLRPF